MDHEEGKEWKLVMIRPCPLRFVYSEAVSMIHLYAPAMMDIQKKNSYSRPYYLDVQVACTLHRRIQAQAEVHRTGADFVKVRNSRKRQRGRWS